MRIALEDLSLDHLVIIYPGVRAYPLADRVTILLLTQVIHGDHALMTAKGA